MWELDERSARASAFSHAILQNSFNASDAAENDCHTNMIHRRECAATTMMRESIRGFLFSRCLAWRRAWYQLIGNMLLLYAKFFIFSLRTWHGKFNTKIYISWCHFWGFEGLHSPHTRQPRRVCSATANKWTKIFDVNLENGNYLLATTHH